jgi:LmbE family N-acetylglucosaminyl deacetylase
MNKVLVIVAHPDDEVLGCGGTIAKLSKLGHEVNSLVLGEGIVSRYQTGKNKGMSQRIKELKRHANKAAKILGAQEMIVLSFPDNQFDSVPLLKIVKAIEVVKNKIKPDVVYTHHRDDLNVDHRVTYNAVMTAFRPIKGETTPERIFSFESLSSTEWNYPHSFSPNVYVGISRVIGDKIKAMGEYKTEIRDWPHPRSIEAIEYLARIRGCEVGLEYAEAFELIREIKI